MKTLSFAVLVAAGLVWGCGSEQIVSPKGSAVETAVSPWDPTVSLSVSPASLVSGGSAILSWSSTNATRCTASGGWTGSKATSGSQSTGPLTATTSFTLTCSRWRWYGWIRAARTVTVTVTSPSVPTLSLSAEPSSVASGGAATLTWTSTNATACTASNGWSGTRATSGTFDTGPLTSTTTFTLACNGAGGSVTQAATVTVTGVVAAPTVVLTANPTSIANGASSSLDWSSTDATTCTATGGWSGTKATSGSQATGALIATTSFTLGCTGPGGTGSASATVTVAPPIGPPPTATFPLRVEAGKRYLVDAQGRAFLMQGDSPWLLTVQLTTSQVDQYLEDRRARGFNTILVEIIEHYFSANPPKNVYGQGPFLTPGDFATPNEAYFAHVEYVISKAAEKGILLLLTPAYMGYGGGSEGWYQEMAANGATKLRAYGQYLATRFRNYDNILWVHGGDYNPPERNLLRAIANGIRDVDTKWLHVFHGQRGTSALEWAGTSEPWMTVNDIYTDATTVVSKAEVEYLRSTMPFFFIEGVYENEGGASALTVRQQAYQALLSGASGQLMGNSPIWLFGSGWSSALNSGGARSMTHLRTLFEAHNWWNLVPDVTRTLLTVGRSSGSNMAAASVASDRSFALLYTPSVRSLTVNLALLAGPNVTARWYDPSSGTYATVSGSPFATASGPLVFRPTGANQGGNGDWVLVLESSP